VARTLRLRIADTAEGILTLDGLVAALVGGGVWAIVAAALEQVTNFRLDPAIAAGAGLGFIAAALFIWFVIRPQRDRQQARAQARAEVLRSSVRRHLSELAAEGRLDWSHAVNGEAAVVEWQRDVESLLLNAFGRATAEQVMALPSMAEQTSALEGLNQRLDELPLRSAYHGWAPRS
jgi:hypothetical protein